MTDGKGAFTFVLHAHIPYVRLAGRWPHGEEWLHEAAVDTYLPLLIALHDLHADGAPYHLTIGITPVLAEQLADGDVLDHVEDYARDLVSRAESDVRRFSRDGDGAREDAARFYVEHYRALVDAFRHRFERDIIGAFRSLQDDERIEIATSAATHGYLPLLERQSSVRAQIAQGVRTHARLFGRASTAFWVPECAYRPPSDGEPGIEELLASRGVQVFFCDTHMLGDASPFMPYRVGGSDVAVIARNQTARSQVWSRHGYPGDFSYREFSSRDSESGHRYWRVTGADTPLAEKALYDPAVAFKRAAEHARHFAQVVEEELVAGQSATGRYAVMAGLYDAELFGHWWFEGVAWLKEVLRLLARKDTVELRGGARLVREHPPEQAIALKSGSWGVDGNDVTWNNGYTSWMWPIVAAAERRIEAIVSQTNGSVDMRAAVDQLCRELLLLESSDWPYLVTTGQAAAYAERRFTQHAERFDALASMIESGDVSRGYVASLRERDKLFPDIDPQDFRPDEKE